MLGRCKVEQLTGCPSSWDSISAKFSDSIPKDKILQLAIQFPDEVESRLSWLDEWQCAPKEEAILPQAMLYTQLIALWSLPSSKRSHFASCSLFCRGPFFSHIHIKSDNNPGVKVFILDPERRYTVDA